MFDRLPSELIRHILTDPAVTLAELSILSRLSRSVRQHAILQEEIRMRKLTIFLPFKHLTGSLCEYQHQNEQESSLPSFFDTTKSQRKVIEQVTIRFIPCRPQCEMCKTSKEWKGIISLSPHIHNPSCPLHSRPWDGNPNFWLLSDMLLYELPRLNRVKLDFSGISQRKGLPWPFAPKYTEYITQRLIEYTDFPYKVLTMLVINRRCGGTVKILRRFGPYRQCYFEDLGAALGGKAKQPFWDAYSLAGRFVFEPHCEDAIVRQEREIGQVVSVVHSKPSGKIMSLFPYIKRTEYLAVTPYFFNLPDFTYGLVKLHLEGVRFVFSLFCRHDADGNKKVYSKLGEFLAFQSEHLRELIIVDCWAQRSDFLNANKEARGPEKWLDVLGRLTERAWPMLKVCRLENLYDVYNPAGVDDYSLREFERFLLENRAPEI